MIAVDSMSYSNASASAAVTYGDHVYSFGAAAFQLAFRWDYIAIYVALKIVQGGGAGGSGLLNSIRSLLWISVEQYTTREVEVRFAFLLAFIIFYYLNEK
jgi:hypothetical protein